MILTKQSPPSGKGENPDDNKFIECALDAKCYYIVSGDKDLLDVKKHKSVQIVTVSEFLDLFNHYSNSIFLVVL